jgi:predicted Fe-S protein YdhL (DUF1289 family)
MRRKIIDLTIPTPCLSVCRFDGDPYCVGCYRNLDEIREWIIMSKEQKLKVYDLIAERKQNKE